MKKEYRDQRNRLLEQKRKAGICVRCTLPVTPGYMTCADHREYQNKAARRMHSEHKKVGLCIHCNHQAEFGYSKCSKHRLKQIREHNDLIDIVFAAYGGPICNCCKETTRLFLTIDHIDGGGNKHRRETGKHFYNWLRRNNFPSGYQILCSNCNTGRARNNGTCPHQLTFAVER